MFILNLADTFSRKHTKKWDKIILKFGLLCALFYTEDFETSLSDYQKALSILEQLVEPDDRKIADLYPCHNSYLDM